MMRIMETEKNNNNKHTLQPMKRKMRLLTMLLMLLVVVTAQACPVGVQQALSTAQQFVRGQVAAGCLRAPAASATLRLAHAEPSAAVADAADYYVFTSCGWRLCHRGG